MRSVSTSPVCLTAAGLSLLVLAGNAEDKDTPGKTIPASKVFTPFTQIVPVPPGGRVINADFTLDGDFFFYEVQLAGKDNSLLCFVDLERAAIAKQTLLPAGVRECLFAYHVKDKYIAIEEDGMLTVLGLGLNGQAKVEKKLDLKSFHASPFGDAKISWWKYISGTPYLLVTYTPQGREVVVDIDQGKALGSAPVEHPFYRPGRLDAAQKRYFRIRDDIGLPAEKAYVLEVLEFPSLKLVQQTILPPHTSAGWSPSGRLLALLGRVPPNDQLKWRLTIWDLNKQSSVQEMFLSGTRLALWEPVLYFTPDERYVLGVSCSWEHEFEYRLWTWDRHTGKIAHSLKLSDSNHYISLGLSPNGRWFVYNMTIKIGQRWNNYLEMDFARYRKTFLENE